MYLFTEHTRCAKCGSEFISTKYACGAWPNGERIVRKCGRCGYSWGEAPLDAVSPADGRGKVSGTSLFVPAPQFQMIDSRDPRRT